MNLPSYNAFMSSIIFILIFFTMNLPISLQAYLTSNRKDLYHADIYIKLGWMYERLNRGCEWWEVHEMMRKMLLTGLIVFYPEEPTIRSSICLFICVSSQVSLNYFQPFRSSLVFTVAQWAFACVTLMFIAGVGLQADLGVGERKQLGVMIIVIACLMVISALVCAIWLVWLIRHAQNRTGMYANVHDFTDEALEAATCSSAEIHAHYDQEGITSRKPNSYRPGRVKVRPHTGASQRRLSIKDIRKAVDNENVLRHKRRAELHRDVAIKAITKRQLKAEAKLRKRLADQRAKRQQMNAQKAHAGVVKKKTVSSVKSWSVDPGPSKAEAAKKARHEALVTPEEIERVRLMLAKKAKSAAKFHKAFDKLDKDGSGTLCMKEFKKLCKLVVSHPSLPRATVEALYQAAWLHRKHESEMELDGPTLCTWLFGPDAVWGHDSEGHKRQREDKRVANFEEL